MTKRLDAQEIARVLGRGDCPYCDLDLRERDAQRRNVHLMLAHPTEYIGYAQQVEKIIGRGALATEGEA